MKKLLPFFLSLLIVSGSIASLPASAQLKLLKPDTTKKIQEKTQDFQNKAGFETVDPYVFVGSLINTALSLLGVIFLILLMYGGYTWLTAGGEEEGVTNAKKIITQAVIGLIIVLASYAISWFVVAALQKQTLKAPVAVSTP